MTAPTDVVIRGELAFDGAPVDLTGASVKIRVDDVSRADAQSVPVAEHPLPVLPRGATTAAAIPFEVHAGPLDARARYSIWAHVDMDRDGQISAGDFITMESFPVSAGTTAYHRVRVRRVD
jgi:uncharacterized lipoprotein YbaY